MALTYRDVAGPTGTLHVALTDPVDDATPVLFLHGINKALVRVSRVAGFSWLFLSEKSTTIDTSC